MHGPVQPPRGPRGGDRAARDVVDEAPLADEQGVPRGALEGTIQNDILKEYIAQKEWISPIRPSLRVIRDMLAYCTREMPLWNTISISGYHIREAGSTAAQELAFTLRDGIEQASVTKHFERFTFAVLGIKATYAGMPLGAILTEMLGNLVWIFLTALGLGALALALPINPDRLSKA
mgnify:CR=1 FL=1